MTPDLYLWLNPSQKYYHDEMDEAEWDLEQANPAAYRLRPRQNEPAFGYISTPMPWFSLDSSQIKPSTNGFSGLTQGGNMYLYSTDGLGNLIRTIAATGNTKSSYAPSQPAVVYSTYSPIAAAWNHPDPNGAVFHVSGQSPRSPPGLCVLTDLFPRYP